MTATVHFTLAPTSTSTTPPMLVTPTTPTPTTAPNTTTPITTTAPTTTTAVLTTTTSTSTTVPTTTTTTQVGAQCKAGWGKGDKNHCHTGPPGKTGDRPGKGNDPGNGGNDQALVARLARNASSAPLLLGGMALIVLAGLVLTLAPWRRLRRG